MRHCRSASRRRSATVRAAPRRRPASPPTKLPSADKRPTSVSTSTCAVARPTHRAGNPRRQPDEVEREQAGRPRVDSSRGSANCSMRPAFITATRSDMVSASSWSCVTKIGGRAELLQQAAQFDLHRLAQLAVERATAPRRTAARRARPRGRAPARRAAAGRPTAPRPAGRRDGRAAPATARAAPRASISRLARAAHLQAEGDVAGDGEMRKQRVVLEHHADVALVRRQCGDVAPGEFDLARVGLREAGDRAAATWSCRSPTGRAG